MGQRSDVWARLLSDDRLRAATAGTGHSRSDKHTDLASGTYDFFKEHALKGGDYKDEVKEQPGSASVVQGVTEDPAGIGYSGIGYTTSGIRALPLSEKDAGPFMAPTQENAMKGLYPLWRHLLVYVNKAPNKPLDPLVREFIKFIYSKEGQAIVIKDGFFPVPQSVIEKELLKVE